MKDALHILFVDDSADDVQLEQFELRQGGLAFAAERVERQPDLVKALGEFRPDLIISDDSMPEINGSTALRIAHAACPEVPFIFVSGTIGEERAIESLKSGATDYVLKDRLGGLVQKVRRALKDAEDRREHRKLEEQFRQAQKMEAIGRLAGGVAHDFNNLLTVIVGYTELILRRVPPVPKRGELEEVLNAAHRAGALTRQLLAFSRKQMITPVVLNLNASVTETQKMLLRLIGEDIEILAVLDQSLGNVRADPGQIEQVIMNLAVNARDAMPQGGKLTIETASVVLDESYVRGHAGAKAGPHVMLSVSDTGHGMDDEMKSHLFEPFFTTKEAGKGTGLGLSTVYGIVNQSGGSIWVDSEPAHGTTFKLYLPRVDEPLKPLEPATPAVRVVAGLGTILVAEDALVVRKLVSEVLCEEGYQVLVAQNGEEALRLIENHPGPIHLLLTDVVMPGVGGKEVADQMTSLRPEAKVLYSSGYTHQGMFLKRLSPGIAYLQKPFTPDELRRKVQEVLAAKS